MGQFDTISKLVDNPEFAQRHIAYEVGPDPGHSIVWPIEVTGFFTVRFFQADFVDGLEPAVEFYERPDTASEDVLSRQVTDQELVVLAGVAGQDLERGNLRVRCLIDYARRRLNENHAA